MKEEGRRTKGTNVHVGYTYSIARYIALYHVISRYIAYIVNPGLEEFIQSIQSILCDALTLSKLRIIHLCIYCKPRSSPSPNLSLGPLLESLSTPHHTTPHSLRLRRTKDKGQRTSELKVVRYNLSVHQSFITFFFFFYFCLVYFCCTSHSRVSETVSWGVYIAHFLAI